MAADIWPWAMRGVRRDSRILEIWGEGVASGRLGRPRDSAGSNSSPARRERGWRHFRKDCCRPRVGGARRRRRCAISQRWPHAARSPRRRAPDSWQFDWVDRIASRGAEAAACPIVGGSKRGSALSLTITVLAARCIGRRRRAADTTPFCHRLLGDRVRRRAFHGESKGWTASPRFARPVPGYSTRAGWTSVARVRPSYLGWLGGRRTHLERGRGVGRDRREGHSVCRW